MFFFFFYYFFFVLFGYCWYGTSIGYSFYSFHLELPWFLYRSVTKPCVLAVFCDNHLNAVRCHQDIVAVLKQVMMFCNLLFFLEETYFGHKNGDFNLFIFIFSFHMCSTFALLDLYINNMLWLQKWYQTCEETTKTLHLFLYFWNAPTYFECWFQSHYLFYFYVIFCFFLVFLPPVVYVLRAELNIALYSQCFRWIFYVMFLYVGHVFVVFLALHGYLFWLYTVVRFYIML